MTDATARQLNRSLYGRPRIPRSHRRVMLALLSGAPGLTGVTLMRLAQAGSGGAYAALARMEARGWVARERREGYAQHARIAYSLTPRGRAAVTLLLGIEAREEAGHG